MSVTTPAPTPSTSQDPDSHDKKKIALPQEGIAPERLQGHWLLARLGKRVLRPGGAKLTKQILDSAQITGCDVIEFAPGMGWTARRLLERKPSSYLGIDRDVDAVTRVGRIVAGHGRTQQGDATATGLDDQCADRIVGEAMLSMHGDDKKREIVAEGVRLLRPGGLYAIHELGLEPNDIDHAVKEELRLELARTLKVNARPLTVTEWTAILEEQGLEVVNVHTAAMALLETRRVIADEGIFGTLRIGFNTIRQPALGKRVLRMRSVFKKHRKSLIAVGIVARKR